MNGYSVEIGVKDAHLDYIHAPFDSIEEAQEWINNNPMNFGPGDFAVVTRIVGEWVPEMPEMSENEIGHVIREEP